jgi:hypothetical protein
VHCSAELVSGARPPLGEHYRQTCSLTAELRRDGYGLVNSSSVGNHGAKRLGGAEVLRNGVRLLGKIDEAFSGAVAHRGLIRETAQHDAAEDVTETDHGMMMHGRFHAGRELDQVGASLPTRDAVDWGLLQ